MRRRLPHALSILTLAFALRRNARMAEIKSKCGI
jgi:hypothetical protein